MQGVWKCPGESIKFRDESLISLQKRAYDYMIIGFSIQTVGLIPPSR